MGLMTGMLALSGRLKVPNFMLAGALTASLNQAAYLQLCEKFEESIKNYRFHRGLVDSLIEEARQQISLLEAVRVLLKVERIDGGAKLALGRFVSM
jgi:hypothetical protein